MLAKLFYVLCGGIAGALVVLVVLFGIVFSNPTVLTPLLPVATSAQTQVLTGEVGSATIIPDMVSRVNDSVVSIVVTKDVPVYERYYEEFNPWGGWGGGFAIPRVRENGVEEQEVGGGSGFIVSSDGMVVTNRHVVNDTEARYSVITTSGESYPVEVLALDTQLDIAILKISELPANVYLEPLIFGDSTSLRLGESVVAIGNALAEFQNSVSVGVVSGLSRSIVATDGFGESEALSEVIQTDAAINPGNSGGPLLNLAGEVVGVNVATSRGADNIAFALPAHVVRDVVESVKETGAIVRPFLGVRYVTVSQELQEVNNLSVDYGALVARGERPEALAVMPGSPADRAGLRENDIILNIDGEDLRGRDLATILRGKKVGQSISLTILSQGQERVITLVLSATP
ncbi:trypsin-like peptidase domain-containing protein [Patescibacteria group bacterium]|nr:trypsin-like peptidase domain-containing protein [Patescibacteria group bacterium]